MIVSVACCRGEPLTCVVNCGRWPHAGGVTWSRTSPCPVAMERADLPSLNLVRRSLVLPVMPRPGPCLQRCPRPRHLPPPAWIQPRPQGLPRRLPHLLPLPHRRWWLPHRWLPPQSRRRSISARRAGCHVSATGSSARRAGTLWTSHQPRHRDPQRRLTRSQQHDPGGGTRRSSSSVLSSSSACSSWAL